MRNSIESLITRGVSIAAKFILLGFLTSILSLEDYGSFQLISYFVMISTTIFGLEFYNITNRRIAGTSEKSAIYQEHLSFFVTTGPFLIVIQAILFFILFPSKLVTTAYFLIALAIGICDYISQEIYRYLMINQDFRKGNLQLIYKALFFLLILWIYFKLFEVPDFESALWIMLIAYCILLAVAIRSFRKTLYRSDGLRKIQFLSKSDLIKKLRAVFPFLVLIVFLKIIEFSDKFIVGHYLGLEDTGIYSFIYSIASSIHIFIVSGFYIIYLPQLIQSNNSSRKLFLKEFRKFGLLIFASSFVLVFALAYIAPYAFEIIGKDIFIMHMNLLWILLIGFSLNNLSLIPHIYLYINGKEGAITIIMAIACVINILLTIILTPKFGIIGAAISFLATFFTVLTLKAYKAYQKWNQTVD